jgi:hypothetical protein
MGKTDPADTVENEAKELVRLCCAGSLYEIELWINEGKSLEIPAATRRGKQRSLIEIAVEIHFGSCRENPVMVSRGTTSLHGLDRMGGQACRPHRPFRLGKAGVRIGPEARANRVVNSEASRGNSWLRALIFRLVLRSDASPLIRTRQISHVRIPLVQRAVSQGKDKEISD